MLLYTPSALPPRLDEVFNLLKRAGVRDAIVYGGALRDADCGKEIRDYDLLISVPEYEACSVSDVHLALQFQQQDRGLTLTDMPHEGRFVLSMQDGLALDFIVSAGSVSAQWKVGLATLGLSAIAMDMKTREVYVTHHYLRDRSNKTLSLLWDSDDMAGLAYAQKIQRKYPDHTILESSRFVARPPSSSVFCS